VSLPIASHASGSQLSLTISPRSSVNRLELASDGSLRVRVTAAPVYGAANAALLKFLAETLALPKSSVTITAGHTSRHKRIVVAGVAPNELARRLHVALDNAN
jgi:uncharacterized protein YggU (UPF0235/DUF167 family)